MFLYYDSLYEKNKELEKGSQWRKCAQKAINKKTKQENETKLHWRQPYQRMWRTKIKIFWAFAIEEFEESI